MNDNFTEAARAEGQARIAAMLEAAGASDDIRAWFPAGFEKGAEWARTHLAAQEPTDAEVEAAAIALYNDDESWGFVVQFAYGDQAVEWDDLGDGPQEMFREFARRALRAARRDEDPR